MPKSKGPQRKSRSVLTKKVRERGKQPLSRLLTTYEEGDKVIINIDPAVHRGMPHKRYQGHVATVIARRGDAYILKIPYPKKVKTLTARPEHLRKHLEG